MTFYVRKGWEEVLTLIIFDDCHATPSKVVKKKVRRNKRIGVNNDVEFWNSIYHGFTLQHQAAYFEVIMLQFFLLFALSDYFFIKYVIGLGGAILIFLGVYLFTFMKKEEIFIFTNKWIRIVILIPLIIIFIGLFGVSPH